ncbi:MAG: tetratricopeptide repeat protein [Casimicrobiaceae bacterium]
MPAGPENSAGNAALRDAHAAWQRGDATAAEALCRKAIALGSDDARAWTLLGIALRHRDPAAAETALRRAMERDPRFADAPFQLGNLLRQQAQFAAAVFAYEMALSLAPGNAAIRNNLALALDGAGERRRAADTWRDVLRVEPGHRQALGNLVHALCRERQHAEAALLFERHLRGKDDVDASLWVDYGICKHHLRDFAAAEESFRRALALAPDDALILTNLGSVMVDGSDFEHAEPLLARAVALDPDLVYAATLLATCRAHLCDWLGRDALCAHILERVFRDDGEKGIANPFTTLSMPMPPAAQLRIAQRWANSLLPSAGSARIAPTRAPRARNGRRRLGYVSSDFRTHAIAFLLAEVWERHDRNEFETFAYSIGPREVSPLRSRIEAAFDHFVECSDDGFEETARRIRDDGIDLLIDLNGYTTHARSEIFALRPAPVALSWLGYLGTMGAEFIDYVITDHLVTPAGMQPSFTERLLPLPHCYCPSDTRREIAPHTLSREAAGLPAEGFVFCCFNAPYKLAPDLFDVWMRLVAGVSGSVLWLAPASPTATGNLRAEAERRGVRGVRLVFASRVAPAEHLARHAHADLFLDTLPYNAGTMANDALFAGLPVLTCMGATMAGRVAASQLHSIGLGELAATDLRGYEEMAFRIAREPGAAGALRARIRDNRNTHPLFDMAAFTRDLESALRSVARA